MLRDTCLKHNSRFVYQCTTYITGHPGRVHSYTHRGQRKRARNPSRRSRPCAAVHRKTNRPATSSVQEAMMVKHESADTRRHLPRRTSDRRIGGTCCSVGGIQPPTAGPRKDGKRRASRRLDIRLGQDDGSHERCCVVSSTRRRCGRLHRVDGSSEQLATATGAAWNIGEVPTVVVDHEGVGDAQRPVGVGAIARSEPPRPYRGKSDER
mmetsp:Transcript_18865/g.38363  ORF Transcript_18865/g.38363 Transcript_18865/m.38363 type:complete len:209 (-) Transcript_18865:38-664(-)